jgi:adenine-specific DNA-methyltransferase
MSIPTAGAAAPIFSSAAATSLLSELTPLARDQMLAAERPAADQINFARAFAFRMVGAWWRALVEKKQTMQPLRECFFATAVTRLTSAQAKSADETGEAISCFALDIGVHQIGIVYMSMLPGEYRSAYGIYYTPAFLVHRLIEQATLAGIDWTCARILDPACGGGAFLAPVARQMVEELRDCSPRILVENIASRLCGYELDPFGAWLSQVTVDAILLPITYQAKKRLPVIVTVCDSLRKDALRETFDLVIGNPPYGRIQLDSATRDMYQRSLYGHANLYGLFTDLALRYAKSGGVIAYVTPTSFLAGEYFKKLRSLLACEAPPVSIDFIAARKGIFEDVLQETLLATYRRGAVPG